MHIYPPMWNICRPEAHLGRLYWNWLVLWVCWCWFQGTGLKCSVFGAVWSQTVCCRWLTQFAVDRSRNIQQSFMTSICFVVDHTTEILLPHFFVTITPHLYNCMAAELVLSSHEKASSERALIFSVSLIFDAETLAYDIFSSDRLEVLVWIAHLNTPYIYPKTVLECAHSSKFPMRTVALLTKMTL